MSSINDKKHPYFDSDHLNQLGLQENGGNVYNTSTRYGPYGPLPPFARVDSMGSSFTVRDNTLFSPFDKQSSVSAQTPSGSSLRMIPQNVNLEKKSDFECNEKIEFKILIEYLENLRQNNQIFQTNVLKELKQMREVMADLKKTIHEMPIRFADAMTQCLDSVNGRSDSLSVDSEPEIVEIFDKIDIINDFKDDNSFVHFSDNSSKELENKTTDEKRESTVDKFVFEYNPYIDLDKWLKKE